MDFTNKIVLVTGASRGIGREVAKQFADLGAKVAVHYNGSRVSAEQTLAALSGSGHHIYQANVADPYAVQRLINAVADEMGGIDVLVNNAGIYTEHPIREIDYDEWRRQWNAILDTNLIGAANAIFCAVPHMIARGGGHVVNVSSRGAFRGEPLALLTAQARRA